MYTTLEPKNTRRITPGSVNMKRLVVVPKGYCFIFKEGISNTLSGEFFFFLDTRGLLPESREAGKRNFEHRLLGSTCHVYDIVSVSQQRGTCPAEIWNAWISVVSLNGLLLSGDWNTVLLTLTVPSWDFSLFFHETV